MKCLNSVNELDQKIISREVDIKVGKNHIEFRNMYRLKDNDIKEITEKEKSHRKKIEFYEEMKMDLVRMMAHRIAQVSKFQFRLL